MEGTAWEKGMNTEELHVSPSRVVFEHHYWVGPFVLAVMTVLQCGVLYFMFNGQEQMANYFMCGMLSNIAGLIVMVVVMAIILARTVMRNDLEELRSAYTLWLVGLAVVSMCGPMLVVAQMVLG